MDWFELFFSAGIIAAVTAFATWVTRETKPIDYVDRGSQEIRSIEERYSTKGA